MNKKVSRGRSLEPHNLRLKSGGQIFKSKIILPFRIRSCSFCRFKIKWRRNFEIHTF